MMSKCLIMKTVLQEQSSTEETQSGKKWVQTPRFITSVEMVYKETANQWHKMNNGDKNYF